MIAFDTNVLVRLLVNDDDKQQQRAVAQVRNALQRNEAVLVSLVVLVELCWVLESGYCYKRGEIAVALQRLLDTQPFLIEERGRVQQALALYLAGSADFSDYVILVSASDMGASTLFSFDKKLLRSEGCEKP